MVAKFAESVGSAAPDPIAGEATTLPVPPTAISNKPAAGQTGPRGMGPRQTYSRVNTGTPPVPDAGASIQKGGPIRGMESLPKLAEVQMKNTTMMRRPDVNALLKEAMEGTLSRADVSAEAARQIGQHGGERTKTASAETSTGHIATEQVAKLASALDYAAQLLEKEAMPGEGPNALQVSAATSSGPSLQPGQSGQATLGNQPPKNPATQTEVVQAGKANTGLETNDDQVVKGDPAIKNAAALQQGNLVHLQKFAKSTGGKAAPLGTVAGNVAGTLGGLSLAGKAEQAAGKALSGVKNRGVAKVLTGLAGPAAIVAGGSLGARAGRAVGKKIDGITGSKKEASIAYLRKLAEDAINPAQISSGTAGDANTVPDGVSAAGEGAVSVPSDVSSQAALVGSNEAAINFTKGQAKADPKKDLGQILNEPALSSASDKVLNESLDNTGAAGVKISSLQGGVLKVAAARALLNQTLKSAGVVIPAKGKAKTSTGLSAPTTPAAASGFTASSM